MLWKLLTGWNVAVFALYGADKALAVLKRRRVPEKVLLEMTAFGGAPGAAVAMFLFRHKTRKTIFRWGVPALLVVQVLLFFFLKRFGL